MKDRERERERRGDGKKNIQNEIKLKRYNTYKSMMKPFTIIMLPHILYLFVAIFLPIIQANTPAVGGYDIIECAINNNCQIGSEDFATNYTSLDIDGTERFEAEFRFISENNVIAFENSPFTYAPKYGGFCSYGIWKNKNNTWTRKKLGPSSNPSKYWRVVKNNNTGEIDIYLFGGKEGADEFIDNLPKSKETADKVWEKMWGKHGTVPPYAVRGGPFNKVCFSDRDCMKDPQKLPSPSILLPFSDPNNNGNWIPYEPLTDEFSGDKLNYTKWSTSYKDLGWYGRPPGLFLPSNVEVENGFLTMYAKAAKRNSSWPKGYDNFTTSAIHSIDRTSKGYFEVRSRSGSSSISSSFWFHQNDGTSWTEIDVYESMGENRSATHWNMSTHEFCSHTHIFKLPNMNMTEIASKCKCQVQHGTTPHCTNGGCTDMGTKFKFDDEFHVAGLLWNTTTVVFYMDGVEIISYPANCFTQEIGVDFDRETMEDWFTNEIPDHFIEKNPYEIDYIRAWKSSG